MGTGGRTGRPGHVVPGSTGTRRTVRGTDSPTVKDLPRQHHDALPPAVSQGRQSHLELLEILVAGPVVPEAPRVVEQGTRPVLETVVESVDKEVVGRT